MTNVLETTWNDNDCCLNIVIALKVVDTDFKVEAMTLKKYQWIF